MKCKRKYRALVLLFSLFMPLITGNATSETVEQRDTSADISTATCMPVADPSLPHRDIFINTFPTADNATSTRTATNYIQFTNGFWYDPNHKVQTKGQANVQAYLAITDYGDEAQIEEFSAMILPFSAIMVFPDITKSLVDSSAPAETKQ